jgi:prophage regulatory protein
MTGKTVVEADKGDNPSPGSADLRALVAAIKESLVEKQGRRPAKIDKVATVEEKTGYKKSWIYAAVRAGTFPAPVSLGGRTKGWVSTEVDDWLEQQIKASRARQGEVGNGGR